MPTPYERIQNISLERLEELAIQAGYKPLPTIFGGQALVGNMLINSQMDVMLVRFAYLIAKELTI